MLKIQVSFPELKAHAQAIRELARDPMTRPSSLSTWAGIRTSASRSGIIATATERVGSRSSTWGRSRFGFPAIEPVDSTAP
jgi:hypothetical protein